MYVCCRTYRDKCTATHESVGKTALSRDAHTGAISIFGFIKTYTARFKAHAEEDGGALLESYDVMEAGQDDQGIYSL